jgi:hypothetical protein
MQSAELTPIPSARVYIPPDSLTATSESGLSGASAMDARDDLLGETNVTTLPVVIVPIERLPGPRWPAFVITLALLLTLLWSVTFVWLIYRTGRLLLSALF